MQPDVLSRQGRLNTAFCLMGEAQKPTDEIERKLAAPGAASTVAGNSDVGQLKHMADSAINVRRYM